MNKGKTFRISIVVMLIAMLVMVLACGYIFNRNKKLLIEKTNMEKIENENLENVDPENVLIKLADAFEKKDIDSIEVLSSDPYSALRRYAMNWSQEEYFKPIGNALRNAKLKTASPKERVYEIVVYSSDNVSSIKDVTLTSYSDRGWILDYGKFEIVPTS
jgi:hypothetical protein